MLELFNVRQTETTSQLNRFLPHLGVAQEWQSLVRLIYTDMAMITLKSEERIASLKKQEKVLRDL